ncbi:fimbria/pilus chaperone family protein [Pseudomonas sp. PHC1]|uniref:fimbria/pilus chaperone family protein n=1 Tax=Pseudomonas sp. PHC1 TaxID=3384759 RepID=UPI00396F5ABF
MKFPDNSKVAVLLLFALSNSAYATGMLPETSVVVIEQSDGEAAINVKNTDSYPALLLTTLISIDDDKDVPLTITPPAARVEPGKSQRVRFILTSNEPLTTERLMRVTFDGVPPQIKGNNEVRMSVRQNLPVIVRPAGLEKDYAPWKKLNWKINKSSLIVSNPSPYVVRLGEEVETLPGNTFWNLPNNYILPGQILTINPTNEKKFETATKVRISPATTWGYTVDHYDAALIR